MLTKDDLERIREQVKLAIHDEDDGVPPMIQRFIDSHHETCSYGRKLARVKWLLIGLAVGAFIAGGGSAFAIARAFLLKGG